MELYLSGHSMQNVADAHGVSIDAITYILRKTKTQRRTMKDAQKAAFEKKKPSFTLRRKEGRITEIDVVGAMLYWAEGYKRDTASGIDFANSDPEMVLLFWMFMKNRYTLDVRRMYFSIYYYEDQSVSRLTRYWSMLLRVSPSQFKHSYKKKNANPHARKLPYGVLHIRYNDKKILRDVLNLIKSCKVRYCVGGGVVNRN